MRGTYIVQIMNKNDGAGDRSFFMQKKKVPYWGLSEKNREMLYKKRRERQEYLTVLV